MFRISVLYKFSCGVFIDDSTSKKRLFVIKWLFFYFRLSKDFSPTFKSENIFLHPEYQFLIKVSKEKKITVRSLFLKNTYIDIYW